MEKQSARPRYAKGAALIGGGLIAGVVVAGTLTANAATNSASTSPTTIAGYGAQAPGAPSGQPPHGAPGEKVLTGATATKVKAAAIAKYPGATVVRIETDADGVYEAHLTKSDGTPVTVEVNKAFQVTGEEAMPARPAGGAAPGGAPGAPGA